MNGEGGSIVSGDLLIVCLDRRWIDNEDVWHSGINKRIRNNSIRGISVNVVTKEGWCDVNNKGCACAGNSVSFG